MMKFISHLIKHKML